MSKEKDECFVGMKPIHFKGETKVLKKPGNMTDEECGPLPIFNDGEQCISCWKATSIWERLRFLFTGKIWLSILSGKTQPPVWLRCKYPFEWPKQAKKELGDG